MMMDALRTLRPNHMSSVWKAINKGITGTNSAEVIEKVVIKSEIIQRLPF